MIEKPRDLLIVISLSAIFLTLDALMFPCHAREYSESALRPAAVGAVLADKTIWESYQRRFVADDGRVIDTGNGGVSHSEGQGYGMLIAVAAADRPSFNKIWKWTKTNLVTRGDHLAAWKWEKKIGKVADANNASDGDLLIAWALAEAAELWRDPSCLEEARAIAHDIFDKAVQARTPHGSLLMPAARGFAANDRRDGPIVNPSYWVFPAFARLARITPELDWRGVAQSGLALVDNARFGLASLPTDWISLANQDAVPAKGFPKVFGYNAFRIPLYLMWSGVGDARRLRPFAEAWGSSDAGVPLLDVDANVASEWLREPGYRALAALARCVVSNVPYPDEFYRFTADQNYYPATLHILSLFAATSNGGSCLDRAVMRRLVNLASRSTTDAPMEGPSSASPIILASLKRATLAPPAAPIETALLRIDDPQADAAGGKPKSDSIAFAVGALALVLGVVFVLRRRFASSAADPDEQALDDAVAAIRKGAPDGSFSVVPRTLETSVFSGTDDIPLLERQIEIAAAACTRLSRTIGLIYFEAPAYTQIEARQGGAKAHETMSSLASELRRSLRATDHVALLGDNGILVCVCLLANLSDLESIARRLLSVVARLELIGEPEATLLPGLSIYPLNGYSGADLINAAREDFCRARDGAENFAAPTRPKLMLAPPATPPEKSAARKRSPSKRASSARSQVRKSKPV